jgi:protein ImuB
MLWMALHFRHLPLEVFARGTPEITPLAVAASSSRIAVIVATNRQSAERGVRCGMAVSAAWGLASDLRVVARDEAAERAVLRRVAAWALQFTSVSSVAEPMDVLLDVGGSLKLFGGLENLSERIRNGLADLGYEASIACAPTPLAAQLFACAGLDIRIRHPDTLRHELGKLPLSLLGCAPETAAMLDRFGIHTIGECFRLPRAGLTRRLGKRFLDNLDRALGRLPDPRPPFVPPPTFNAALPLPAPVEQSAALLFAGRRLLAELCGFMTAAGSSVQRLSLALSHEDHTDTRVTVSLVAATRDLDHLTTVLRERLARLELPRPAIAIALAAEQFFPFAARSLSFLPDVYDRAETAARLIEQLRAHLGDRVVCGLTALADHRPECAWQACEPGKGIVPAIPAASFSRPLWLFAAPRRLKEAASSPCWEGPLSLLAGPERIETGWWDGNHVARDYFVARNPAQSLLWIYREHDAEGKWYLHGVFG